MTWCERAAAEAGEWAEEQISALLNTNHTRELLRVAKPIIGYEAFSLGFEYGLVSHPLSEIAGLGELVTVFVLADVHERFFAPMGSTTLSLASMGPTSTLARRWLDGFNGPSSFRHRTKAAYLQREEIITELKAVMSDPIAFFSGLPGRLKDEYTEKWRQSQLLRAKADPRSQFEAGKIAGEVTMEILLLLAGLVAAGTTAVKLAGKAPRLLEWARTLRAPERLAASTGSSTAAFESASATPKPKSVVKTAPKPLTEPTSVNEALVTRLVATRLSLNGVTAAEMDRAAAPTSTYEAVAASQMAAREKVATQFYLQYGKAQPARVMDEVQGIDLTKPVKVGPPPPLTDPQYQWRVPGRSTGQYFTDADTSPRELGILNRGNTADGAPVWPRLQEKYAPPGDSPYMQSTTAPIKDKWSIIGQPAQHVEGGGVQRYIPDSAAMTKIEFVKAGP